MKNNSIWPLYKKYYEHRLFPVFVLITSVTIMAILSALIPWYGTQFITLIQQSESHAEIWEQAIQVFILTSVLILTRTLFSTLFDYTIDNKISQPCSIEIQKDYMIKVLQKHQNFWNKTSAGDAWSKITSISRAICEDGLIFVLSYHIYQTFISLSIMIYLIGRIYLPLGIVFLCGSILILFVCYIVSANTAKASAQQENFLNKTFGMEINTISHHFIVKIFGMIKTEAQRLDKYFSACRKGMVKNSFLRIKNHFFLSLFLVSFECTIIIYAVLLWTKGYLNVGHVIFVLGVAKNMTDTLNQMIHSIMYAQSIFFKMRNNVTLLNKPEEIEDIPHAPDLKISTGEIVFKNLTFAYAHKNNVLENLNLTIKAHEKVGIVGMSGGGKSTLLNLLQRILETPQNSIFIDGQDITKVTQESLHEALAYIPQDTTLFHRTVLDNLKYGNFQATQKHIEEIAKEAYVDQFIEDLPSGYATMVGDKGVKLSGGQCQRIGIARAFLKNSPILLLDEATSALDSLSEKYIQKSLRQLIQNKTVLIVAHRLSTLKNMDRIIVLNQGKIIEEGTPKELLKRNGKFAELWNLQA